jgi:hypothetical protein
LQRIQYVQEGKRHQKKRHLAAFVFVPSVFGGEIWAEISCWEVERKYQKV